MSRQRRSSSTPKERNPLAFLMLAGALGAAFGLGSKLGTNDGTASRQATPLTSLSQIKARSQAYEEMKQNVRLTFHERLAEPAPKLPVEVETPSAQPKEAAVASTEPADRAPAAVEAAVGLQKAIEKPVRTAAEEPVKIAEANDSADEPASDPNGAFSGAMRDALARILDDDIPVRTASPKVASATGPYIVQLASSADRAALEKMANPIAVKTRIHAVSIKGTTVYRLQAIGFADRTTAEAAARRLGQQLGVTPLVRQFQ